jgi:hypothetical protein
LSETGSLRRVGFTGEVVEKYFAEDLAETKLEDLT